MYFHLFIQLLLRFWKNRIQSEQIGGVKEQSETFCLNIDIMKSQRKLERPL